MNTKELGLTVATTLWSAGFFGALGYAFNRPALDTPLLVVLGGVAFVEAALLAIALGFVRQPWLRVALLALPPLVLIGAGMFSASAIVGAVLLLLFLLSARRAIAWEMNNRLRFRVWPMFAVTARFSTLGVLLGSIGLIYPWLLNQVQVGGLQVQPAYLNTFVKPIEPFLTAATPGYTSGMTINQLITSQVDQKAQQSAGDSFAPSTDQQRAAALVQLQQRFGVAVHGSDSLPTLVASMINRQLTNLTTHFPAVVTLLIIAVLFLTLRALVPLLTVPVLALVWVLVWLGKQTGFFQLVTETATIEKLTL